MRELTAYYNRRNLLKGFLAGEIFVIALLLGAPLYSIFVYLVVLVMLTLIAPMIVAREDLISEAENATDDEEE